MKTTLLALSLASSAAFAQGANPHAGHGQHAMGHMANNPSAAPATSQGALKKGKHFNLEMMPMKEGLAFFAKSKDGKDLNPAELILTGNAKAGQLSSPIKFTTMGNHIMADFEKKVPGPFELKIDAMRSGKQDSFTFTYEQGKY